MTERICVLHIGTHKTATTLLQNFLQWNAATLAEAGLHFPSAGWYGVVPGQHAVAWELYDAGGGTETERLLEELGSNPARNAVVSSEEFSLLFHEPKAIGTLVEGIRSKGYTVKILAYLRSQPAFAESMYAERIKHGDVCPLSDFISGVLETGGFIASGRHVTLQLSELLEPFAQAAGVEAVHTRQYTPGSDSFTIIHDFLAALSLLVPQFEPGKLRLDVHRTRMNESLSFGHLLGTAFVALFPEAGLPDNPDDFIAAHVPAIPRDLFDRRFSLLRRDDYARFLERFADDNRRVMAKYGTTAPFLTVDDIPNANDARWAVASIERPLLDTCLSQWLERARRPVGYQP